MNRRAVINIVLAAVLVALCGWLGLFATRGATAAPGSTPAEQQAQTYADVREAARAETIAFLTIDHTQMDETISRVLAGATGEFKKEYKASLEALKKAAKSQESFSEGEVDKIGLGNIDSDSASVFVAASSEVRNKGTNGETETRNWRIKLTMVQEGDRWLVSKLEFVG